MHATGYHVSQLSTFRRTPALALNYDHPALLCHISDRCRWHRTRHSRDRHFIGRSGITSTTRYRHILTAPGPAGEGGGRSAVRCAALRAVLVLMWYRPPFENPVLLAVYYALAYALFDSAATFVYMPFYALTPELTSTMTSERR